MKHIGVLTTTRADYGYLQPVIDRLHVADDIDLTLFVSGTHFSQDYGLSVEQINYPISHNAEILMGLDTESAVSKSFGLAMIQFSEQIKAQALDMMVLLGDRFETLAMAICCHNQGIPIAHISGGEVTEGSLDNGYRHCISQLADLHFVYCDQYAINVIKRTGANDVFNIGLLTLETMLIVIEIEDAERSGFVVIVHPPGHIWIDELLQALPKDEPIMLISPNADAGHEDIWEAMVYYVQDDNFRVQIREHLSRDIFLKLLTNSKALIGNSSAGIYEAPYLGTPTINIGDRQKGRPQASSIINCEGNERSIREAIDKLDSLPLRAEWKLPFERKESSKLIVEHIREYLC